MKELLPMLAVIAIGIALGYGAYTDLKQRIIPNKVPVVILLCGCFTATPWGTKLLHLALIIVVLVAATKITKLKSGGGDIKIYCSLSFALGLMSLAAVLIGVLVLKVLIRTTRREKRERFERFPFGTYIAVSYVIVVLLPTLLLNACLV